MSRPAPFKVSPLKGMPSWDVAQLMGYTPKMHGSVGSVPSTMSLGTVVHARNCRTREVETGGSGVQGHPQLHSESETILYYMKSHAKTGRCQ